MKTKTNVHDIIESWDLWCEYVDPSGIGTREEWDAMTPAERLKFVQQCFPDEQDDPPMMD